jgi:RNA polymerase sigma-70 factor (ECF subfamily)
MNSSMPSIITSFEDDKYLVSSIKKGNREALSILYDKYGGCLLGIIVQSISIPEQAEEVLKKCFTEIWHSISDFNDKYLSLFQWLRNLTIKQIRVFQNNIENKKETAIQSVFIPVCILESVNRLKQVLETDGQLINKEHEKLILDLIYIGGNKLDELAVYLNIPIDNMKHILVSAIKGMTNTEKL